MRHGNTYVEVVVVVLLKIGRLDIYCREIDGREPLQGFEALRTRHIYTIVRRRRFVRVALDVFVDRTRYVRWYLTRLGHGRREDLIPLGRSVVVVAFLFARLGAHTLR